MSVCICQALFGHGLVYTRSVKGRPGGGLVISVCKARNFFVSLLQGCNFEAYYWHPYLEHFVRFFIVQIARFYC